jgi:crossover junction endodeoxyribonuclease RuvC
MRILGIDPGTAVTGYSVIDHIENKYILIECGVVKTNSKEELANRLHDIYLGIEAVILRTQPKFFAIEDIFYSENVKTALTLAHTRGALMVCARQHQLEVGEYAAREIKQASVGNGNASKEQVQYMVKILLGLKEAPKPADASDACAVAICHANNLKRKSLFGK